jgi:hypothetical protein
MKKQIETLNKAIEEGLLNPEDFYCITIYQHSINAQGEFTSVKSKKYQPTGFDENGCASGFFYCDGIKFNIALT